MPVNTRVVSLNTECLVYEEKHNANIQKLQQATFLVKGDV